MVAVRRRRRHRRPDRHRRRSRPGRARVDAARAGVHDIDPAISPDGRWVAFERDHEDGSADIGLVRADGRDEHVVDLGCTEPCADDLGPTWSPDGKRLLFTRVVGPFDAPNESAASAVLWTSDLEGKHVRRVSEPGIDGVFEDYRATFAPAGYVVFVRVRDADRAAARSSGCRLPAKTSGS